MCATSNLGVAHVLKRIPKWQYLPPTDSGIKSGIIIVQWHTLESLEGCQTDRRTYYGVVKRRLMQRYQWYRHQICLGCGKPFTTFDMHHGIVSRNDVRGWRHTAGMYNYADTRLMLITNELNCIPLHHTCNTDNPPTRAECWAYQTDFYGHLVAEWYETLPWKTGKPPRRFSDYGSSDF